MMEENKKEKELEINNQEVKETVDTKTEVKEVSTENDTKFKKVEVSNKKEKNVKKKKHRILKTILILIGLVVVAYFIFAIRNFLILKDILIKAGKFENIDNYSYETNTKQEDVEFNTKYVSKDGFERMDIDNITYQDRDLVVWKDNHSAEELIVFPETKVAVQHKESYDDVIGRNFPFQFVQMDENMSGLGLFSLIYSNEFNGKDCYVIQIASDYKLWVEKETGLVVKEESNGAIVELKGVSIQNIEDITKPDLTGYKVNE